VQILSSNRNQLIIKDPSPEGEVLRLPLEGDEIALPPQEARTDCPRRYQHSNRVPKTANSSPMGSFEFIRRALRAIDWVSLAAVLERARKGFGCIVNC
jgi:hypothetical protein